MGKGDKRSKKGKIRLGSYGNTRRKKKKGGNKGPAKAGKSKTKK
ncbi:MAG: 30S ribosomal protein THX [Bacteroidia bacterium]|nr:30S ribosomal protein THX [Bacteroidia bacterium]